MLTYSEIYIATIVYAIVCGSVFLLIWSSCLWTSKQKKTKSHPSFNELHSNMSYHAITHTEVSASVYNTASNEPNRANDEKGLTELHIIVIIMIIIFVSCIMLDAQDQNKIDTRMESVEKNTES